MAIFLESEIWPCMFREIKFKKLPLILLHFHYIVLKNFDLLDKFKDKINKEFSVF